LFAIGIVRFYRDVRERRLARRLVLGRVRIHPFRAGAWAWPEQTPSTELVRPRVLRTRRREGRAAAAFPRMPGHARRCGESSTGRSRPGAHPAFPESQGGFLEHPGELVPQNPEFDLTVWDFRDESATPTAPSRPDGICSRRGHARRPQTMW
jgi:hypothetical protein